MKNMQKYRRLKNLFFETELPGCLGRLHEKYPEKKLEEILLSKASVRSG